MRGRIALAVVVVLSMATPASAALQPATADVGASTATPQARDAVDDPKRTTASEPVVHEAVTFNRTPGDAGSVTVTLEYGIPTTLAGLTLESSLTGYDDVSVVAVDGFERRDAETFEWDGTTANASVVLEYAVDDRLGPRSFGVERGDWAFAYLPNPEVSAEDASRDVELRTSSRVAGNGHASEAYGLDGAVSTTTRSAGDANLTVVVAPGARPRTELDGFVSLYRFGAREFTAGERYDDTAVFVLPDAALARVSPAGTTVNRSVWLQDRYSDDDDVESIPAHEYVHTRLGSFGEDSSRWLTEAAAEYYGLAFSMNRNNGDWTAFREALVVDRQRIAAATLTEPYTWANGFVPYQKGSRVLAALDATIRERTDGQRTLQHVLAYRHDDGYGDLGTYENFSAAVVAVTDDPGMREWLDRYVDGGALPPLPADPDRFVLNDSMDSDGDGVTNGEEDATNPFDADTDDDGVPDGEDDAPTATPGGDGPGAAAEAPTETPTDRSTAGGEPEAMSATRETDGTGPSATTDGATDAAGDVDDRSGSTPAFGIIEAAATLALLGALAARRSGR